MSARKTLWEFLDSSDPTPRVIDTHDDDLDAEYFSPDRAATGPRWKIALSAGLGLVACVIVVAVASHVFQGATSTPHIIEESPLSGQAMAVAESNTEPGTVVVHIAGAVHRPGVVELPVNSRIIDALALVGGPTEDAVLAGVNLARVLFDGEQIVVPTRGEQPDGQPSAGNQGPLSLSRANQGELETLPRIGPATAARIIAWREVHGPFRSVDDVLAISGIGPATLEGIRALVVP